MYQLILSDEGYAHFKRDAKVEMLKQGKSYQDLSDATGYSLTAIYSFFSKKRNASRFLAYSIAEELNMKGEYGYVKDN